MELREISPAQWDQITRSLVSLVVCVGLGLCGALTFLALRVAVPSDALVAQVDPVKWLRRTLWPLLVLSLLGMVIALAVGVSLAIDAIDAIYPRFLV